ncbi:hypothetical protein E8E12_003567 [Didymella heteroderae]|uniref:Mog1p/PsbP-like protein n=1 Tax=Didymella heteroderae TaxID=1769908 RepID=A0A9P4WJC4_9PLEO|nr:hypothetical protein E8E12_003567 [Didymella heteroderae]
MSFTNTPLYGGAITVDLPSKFADTSQIREVPDHQEVYLDSNGYSSIVVEILEYQEKGSDEEALQYHFADLIDEEDSTNILEQGRAVMAKLSDKPVYTLRFIQTPPTNTNPNRKVPEYVYIHLMLLRLKEQETDLMISVNIPHYPGEYEKPKEGQTTQLMEDSEKVKDRILETFDIKDWSLFEA